jgi:hypothetical protein
MVVHPTFLYELLWNLAVAALVVAADRRFRLGHGRAFAVYVAGYTLGRFFIELMRTDPATRVFGDIRINVVVSAVVFAGAVAYLLIVRKPREVPPSGPTPGDPDGPDGADGADDADDPDGPAPTGSTAATPQGRADDAAEPAADADVAATAEAGDRAS